MKTCYLISYDMAEDGDYEELFSAIKRYKRWAHITESLWAVVTEQSAAQIRDALGAYFPEGSRLFAALVNTSRCSPGSARTIFP